MPWTRDVLLSPVQSVRVVCIHGRSGPPRVCLTRNNLTFLNEGIQVAFEERSAASAVQEYYFASKRDKPIAGCTISREPNTQTPEGWGAHRWESSKLWLNCSTYTLSYQERCR